MGARAWVVVSLVALGCGDGIDCPDDLGLELVSPAQSGPITLADDRSGRPGVQVDVALRSVLQAGEPAELVVSGADGGEEQHTALANDEGELNFPLVTLPTGDVALSVHATSSRCGEDTLVTALSVLGPACALDLAEDAVLTDTYEADVLNQSVDSDPAAPGFQAHVAVLSEEDFEVEIFTVYGDTETSVGITVADGGSATLLVTLVQGAISLRAECRSTESSDSSISLPHEFFVDTVAPVCVIDSPAEGALIDPGLDEEPDPGVQVTLRGRVIGSDVAGESGSFTVGGTAVPDVVVGEDGAAAALASFEENGPVEIGLRSQDHALNECTAGVGVSVNLASLSVAFDPPISTGVVGPADGTVGPDGLDLEICGTVSNPPDSVAVTIDGGAPIAADITGTSFCAAATLAESPPAHLVSAVAVAEDDQASAEVDLIVDLTAPSAPGALSLTGLDRQALEVSFVAPDDGESGVAAYQLKIASRRFTPANFDSIGSDLPAPPPAAPGTTQSLVVESLRAGSRIHVGAVAIDRAGNRSLLATAGPLVLRLDGTEAIAAGDDTGRHGAVLASGLLDGDGFADLAVGAPLDDGGATDRGRVRLYGGGANGISGPPDRSLSGPTAGGRFGAALAVLDWNGDGESDLAVGAPGAAGGSGRVYIYLGPVIGASGPADAVVSVAASSAVLRRGEIGSSLAAADFDGDGGDDLVIGAPGAASGDGAAVVLFGGALGAIPLDETDPSGPAGHLIAEQGAVAGGRFGEHVFGLGATESPLDGDDDVGVAYRDEYVAFVLRGRARPAAGLAALDFDPGADLRLENPSSDLTTGFATQMVSLGDQDGDGTRDLAVGAWLQARGRIYIVRGGLSGVRQTTGSAVRSTIVGSPPDLTHLGVAIADNLATGAADIDMDGREDLILTGDAGRLRLYVFFGGSIPTGRVDADLAAYQESGPAGFLGEAPGTALPAALVWAGDVNGDGLDDLAWGDPGSAAFQVWYDAP
ncbi:MAG TPA: hypothetical protein VIG06_06915 [Kofleriaceae bacterium]